MLKDHLDLFICKCKTFVNYVDAYIAYYDGYARSYFQTFFHDKERRKVQYKSMEYLPGLKIWSRFQSEEEFQKMEDHTKLGYIFILAHNSLVCAFEVLYNDADAPAYAGKLS